MELKQAQEIAQEAMTTLPRHIYWCRCGYGCDSPAELVTHSEAQHDEAIRLVNLRGEPMPAPVVPDDEPCPYCRAMFRSVSQHIQRSHKEETR